jgi:predicted phosphodiesterase
MRIQLFSDLHLERDPTFRPYIAPDTDVVVLAGDIGSYQPGSRLGSTDFGLELFAPALGAPCPVVLFVPGNHEFDSMDFAATTERLRATCARLGITWLDRQVVIVDGVRFMGTTLWSDFDALAMSEPDITRQLAMRNKAMRAANYYLSKNTTLTDGAQVLAEGLREMSLACQAWLRSALAAPFDGKTVVVTHFAPSLLSADPRCDVTVGGCVDARAPALPERLCGRRQGDGPCLPRSGQSAGLSEQERADPVPAAPRDRGVN